MQLRWSVALCVLVTVLPNASAFGAGHEGVVNSLPEPGLMVAAQGELTAGTGGTTEEGGGMATAPYPPVLPGLRLEFPRDYGAHPDFRTEWWYATGWTRDERGAERGFQITFFRVRTLIGEDSSSRFAPSQLIIAHAAIADPARGRLLHAERAGRAFDPLAGAYRGSTRVWLDDWSFVLESAVERTADARSEVEPVAGAGDERGGGEGEAVDRSVAFSGDHDRVLAEGRVERYRARIAAEQFSLDLGFVAKAPPVLNGDGGWSQKAPGAAHSSYYYSRPQLVVDGTMVIDGREMAVTGHAWLDHEWSTEILPEQASGWDWIGINLHDGGSLMAFQMRDHNHLPIWNAATHVEAGNKRIHSPDEVRFRPLREWVSPRTGRRYPVEWEVRVGERFFLLRPLMDDQELDSRASTGSVYWEGAVRLFEKGGEIGQGYLEMTGYGDRLRM